MDELFAGYHDAARPWSGRVLQRLFLDQSMTYKTYIDLQCRSARKCRYSPTLPTSHYSDVGIVGLHDPVFAE